MLLVGYAALSAGCAGALPEPEAAGAEPPEDVPAPQAASELIITAVIRIAMSFFMMVFTFRLCVFAYASAGHLPMLIRLIVFSSLQSGAPDLMTSDLTAPTVVPSSRLSAVDSVGS